MSRVSRAWCFAFAAMAMSFAFAEPVKMGLWKRFDYDEPTKDPIFYSGESKAENVVACEYSIFLDIYYADGSVTWGERADFASGTHDWQKVSGAFVPKKPIKRIEVWALCRKGKGNRFAGHPAKTETARPLPWSYRDPTLLHLCALSAGRLRKGR